MSTYNVFTFLLAGGALRIQIGKLKQIIEHTIQYERVTIKPTAHAYSAPIWTDKQKFRPVRRSLISNIDWCRLLTCFHHMQMATTDHTYYRMVAMFY